MERVHKVPAYWLLDVHCFLLSVTVVLDMCNMSCIVDPW